VWEEVNSFIHIKYWHQPLGAATWFLYLLNLYSMLLIYTRQEVILDSIGRTELGNNSLYKKIMEIMVTVLKTDI